MAGKFLHVMAVLFDQSHAAPVTTNSQSVHTWKFHSAIDRTSERERQRKKMAFSLDLKRVLISDSVDSCCKTILEANGIAVDLKTKLTKEELLAEIPVRESRSTCIDKICVVNRYFLGFHWANFFPFRTMMV